MKASTLRNCVRFPMDACHIQKICILIHQEHKEKKNLL